MPELLEALEQKDHIIREQQLLLKLLEEKLRLSRLQRFGASSEKLSFQVDFFDEAELEVALSDLEAQLPEDPSPKKPCKKRKGFSDQLPRIRVELVLTDEEKAGADKTFFTKVKGKRQRFSPLAAIVARCLFHVPGQQGFNLFQRIGLCDVLQYMM